MVDEPLAQIRTYSGLTVSQLASLFGVSRQMLYKWIHGNPCHMEHKEHVLEVSVLIQEAHERLGKKLCNWLLTPVLPGGKKPLIYLAEKQYDVFRGFLLHARIGSECITPLAPSGRIYQERPREEIEETLERLRPRAYPEDDEELLWVSGVRIPDEVI